MSYFVNQPVTKPVAGKARTVTKMQPKIETLVLDVLKIFDGMAASDKKDICKDILGS